MCGLYGHASLQSKSDGGHNPGKLLSTQHALKHRGPNDHGLVTILVSRGSGQAPAALSLGHTRLSIIDLSPGGHQPMSSPDGRYTIVFNGEIYNYKELRAELKTAGHAFQTNSDTEVLLVAWRHWGLAGLRQLSGMFAFVIYDREDQSLTLVRDAFGIKPLFYASDAGSISFASEIPALLELLPGKPGLDLQTSYDYLVFGSYDDQARTFYEGVSQVLPGHWLRFDLSSMQASEPERWWWPSIQERTGLSFQDASEQLREMFLRSVQLHLRSDVPLGAALSGGLDSSAVVCAMRHLEPEMPIHTFTFAAPEEAIDESAWAAQVNEHVGAIPHRIEVHPNELAADLDAMIAAQGEPFGSTSIYAQFRVFKAAREAGMVVTLDGQGADELLAGYAGYPHARLRTLVSKGELVSSLRFLRRWSQWPGRSLAQIPQLMLVGLLPPMLKARLRRLHGRSSSHWLDHDWFQRQGIAYLNQSTGYGELATDRSGRNLSAALRQDLTISGLPPLLRHADRNSMHWSLESRVPFLTTQLAEFLLSMPEHYLISANGETKHLFRAAMRGIVPDPILDRRDKVGFATPELRWLQQLQPVIPAWLHAAEALPFLKQDAISRQWQETLAGRQPFSWQLWRLINFCRWYSLTQPQIL